MVSLDVAIVVGPRHIGWIHVNQVHTLFGQVEHIRPTGSVVAAVVEHGGVVDLDGLQEMLLKRQLEVSPFVLVVAGIAGDSENPPRLSLDAGADQSRDGQAPVITGRQTRHVGPDVVEKLEVLRRKEDARESVLDESFSAGVWLQQDPAMIR